MLNRLQIIQKTIHTTLLECHRMTDSVQLLAVSKGQPITAIQEAINAGIDQFGENYWQEAEGKIKTLQQMGYKPGKDIYWHFLGPIQRNKTRGIAENFSWVHSIDRLIIAQRLSAERPANLEALQMCVQVNIDDDPNKSGVSKHHVSELVNAIAALPRLRLRGLMCIPHASTDEQQQLETFQQLNQLLHQLNTQYPLSMDTLSMGMTHDYVAAIRAGSTWVRIGEGLFGPRTTLRR